MGGWVAVGGQSWALHARPMCAWHGMVDVCDVCACVSIVVDASAWVPVQAWLAPSETGIFRIGCDAAKPPAANATDLAKPGGARNGAHHNQTIRQSDNPAIQQSNNPTIQQSNNSTIQQSVNPTIRQSNNPARSSERGYVHFLVPPFWECLRACIQVRHFSFSCYSQASCSCAFGLDLVGHHLLSQSLHSKFSTDLAPWPLTQAKLHFLHPLRSVQFRRSMA